LTQDSMLNEIYSHINVEKLQIDNMISDRILVKEKILITK